MMDNQEFNPPLVQNSPRPKLVYVLIVGLVLVLGGIGGYLLGAKKTSAPAPTVAPKTTTNYPLATTSDETANWKVYEDKEMGFLIKYPSDLFLFSKEKIRETKNDEYYIALNPIDYFNNRQPLAVTFKISIAAVQNINNFSLSNPKQMFGQGPLLKYSQELAMPSDVTIKETQLNGLRAYRVDGCCGGYFWIESDIYTIKNGFLYEIVMEPIQVSGDKQSNQRIYDQILSTFKFLPQVSPANDETAGWKIYTNNEKGYSIKYPNEKFVRLVCPGEELTLIQREQGDEREIVNMPTCNRGGRYDIEIITKNSEFNIPQKNEYFSIDKKEIMLNGTKAMKYTTKMIKEYPGPAVSFSVQVFVNNGGKYHEIFLGRQQLSDLFDQILSTFRFL